MAISSNSHFFVLKDGFSGILPDFLSHMHIKTQKKLYAGGFFMGI